ncbi:DUF551 domain-containing protein [Acinetobacter baumannii]
MTYLYKLERYIHCFPCWEKVTHWMPLPEPPKN